MEVPPEDASALLQKLINESIKVQAVFDNVEIGVFALVIGFVTDCGDGKLCVSEPLEDKAFPQFCFKPSFATVRKYADERGFVGTDFVASKLSSALCFTFPNRSRLCLFEISE